MNLLWNSLATGGIFAYAGISRPIALGLLIIVTLWSVIWKGIALWVSARNYQRKWFVVLLVVNTVGIVEIAYLLFFRRDKKEGVTQSLFNTPLSRTATTPTSDEKVASSPAS